jgi:hypothetical protein
MRIRRTHLLDGLGKRTPIEVDLLLKRGHKRDRGKPPVPSSTLDFELELADFGDTWDVAVERARELAAERVMLDGIALRSTHVAKIEVSFQENDASKAFEYGTVHFVGTLAEPLPFPFVPGRVAPAREGDVEFFEALEAASVMASPIQVDEIEELEGYWVFPVHSIGNTGAFVDRRSGRVVAMGSPLPTVMWIWGYERGLLEDDTRDVVVEHVTDRSRAFEALKRFARVRAKDLDSLPLVLEECATWQAVLPLHDAGDALTWRVAIPTAS